MFSSFLTKVTPAFFVAVNKSFHWSLCIVVNPGAIDKHFQLLSDEAIPITQDDPFPCLLFFDALKAHAKDRVASHVRKWLNSEWARLNPDAILKKPFASKSMVIYSPKGLSS